MQFSDTKRLLCWPAAPLSLPCWPHAILTIQYLGPALITSCEITQARDLNHYDHLGIVSTMCDECFLCLDLLCSGTGWGSCGASKGVMAALKLAVEGGLVIGAGVRGQVEWVGGWAAQALWPLGVCGGNGGHNGALQSRATTSLRCCLLRLVTQTNPSTWTRYWTQGMRIFLVCQAQLGENFGTLKRVWICRFFRVK